MADSSVRQWDGRRQRAGERPFDLVLSKLRPPARRAQTVDRSLLIDRLAGPDLRPIVSVVAPPGFGKTTLLSQWAERGGQAFAWVSVEETDNDPKVLLTYVAEALDTVQPIGQRVFEALTSPGSSVPGSVVPRLAVAFASMTRPVVLVLDDVHVLRNRECRAAVSALADHVPGGSQLVLAGRARPPLRIARLRAEVKLAEVGPGDLVLTREEAASLLRQAGLTLGEEEVAKLHRRTEGWPAALYLAALHLRQGGSLPRATVTFGGANRIVSDYLEEELLSQLPRRQRAFLIRTAVLERMSGPLCEAVLRWPGATAVLADLARSNMLLVPLDEWGGWYRYHHLFRDMLVAELHRREPGLVPVLRRRAASWCLRNRQPEEALEYAMAAGDVDMATRLVEQLWRQAYRQARVTTVERWFRWLEDQGAMENHPMVAVLALFLATQLGRPAEAERWADVVDRWRYGTAPWPDDPSAKAWAAVYRAIMCRRGVEQMRADADEAAERFAAANIVESAPALFQGLARVLAGDLDDGDAFFEKVLTVPQETSTPEAVAVALGERSLLAMTRGDWTRAGTFAEQAGALLRRARFEGTLVYAAQASAAVYRGDIPAARRQLINAQRVRPLLTYAIPHIAVQARIVLTRAHIALADLGGARTLMREIDELLRHRPGLGTLAAEAQALRRQLSKERRSGNPGASALTAAELRLLPLLSADLPLSAIAAELFLSQNTVKTHKRSIYRKLGAASRNQAVTQARELGLLEG